MLEVFQYLGCVGYSEIIQKEVCLNHARCWKSLNIKSISKLGKFQYRSALPIIKYNSAVFLRQIYSYLCMLPDIFSHRPPLQNLNQNFVKPLHKSKFVYFPSGCDSLTKYILPSRLYFKAFYLFRVMFIYFIRLLYVIVL